MSHAANSEKLSRASRTPLAAGVGRTKRDGRPVGVDRVNRAAPSGCSYWKLAAEGKAFYTEMSDHHNCPIGAYTHGADLPADKLADLESTIGMMVGLEYIKPEEVPTIPRLTHESHVMVYAPLGTSPCDPDVVIVRGNAKQVMMLSEAARSAGAGASGASMGRPTCAVVPFVAQSGQGVSSVGCIGNRVYTELGDDELYYAMPGASVAAVLGRLETIVRANSELESWHRERAHRISL